MMLSMWVALRDSSVRNGHLTFLQFNVVPANQTGGNVTGIGNSGVNSSISVTSRPTVRVFSYAQP